MNVLVTGGAGFIGSHVVAGHLARGDRVHVVDDLSTGSEANLEIQSSDGRLRFDEADLLVWSGLEKACEWADRVYHLAAVVGVFRVLEAPARVFAVNVAGTERVLRAVRAASSPPRLLVASSSEVYGPDNAGDLDEEMILHLHSATGGRWSYAVSKLASESATMSYARQYGISAVVVRLFNTIGPRQTGRYGMVVPRLIRQAVAGEPITVFGDGSQSRCFCDVRDSVAAQIGLLDHPESGGRVFNIGGDREIEIRRLAELIRDRADSDSEIRFVPHEQAYGEPIEEIVRRRPSLARLRDLIDYTAAYPLIETLDELIAAEREARRVEADSASA